MEFSRAFQFVSQYLLNHRIVLVGKHESAAISFQIAVGSIRVPSVNLVVCHRLRRVMLHLVLFLNALVMAGYFSGIQQGLRVKLLPYEPRLLVGAVKIRPVVTGVKLQGQRALIFRGGGVYSLPHGLATSFIWFLHLQILGTASATTAKGWHFGLFCRCAFYQRLMPIWGRQDK